jgi:hypothetical protein
MAKDEKKIEAAAPEVEETVTPEAAVSETPEAEVPAVTEPAAEAVDEVAAKLAEVGVTDVAVTTAVKELGVETAADFADVDKSDLVAAGLKPVQANKLIKGVSAKPAAATDAAAPIVAATFDGILPSVLDDENWLTSLRAGGVLKIGTPTVTAAIRAALANKVGLYEIPNKLVDAMEAYADENDDPVGETFFALRDQITQNTYGDIFAAIPGLKGSFITEGRKKDLFKRIDSRLWSAIGDSFFQLKAWQEAWLQGAGNPAVLMMGFLSGGSGAALPPGMMAPPDTGALRDAGDDINDAINRVFSGTGAVTASALAFRSNEIRKALENPQLPAMIGTANREQMLKKLGVGVTASYARLETNIVKYVLSFIEAKNIAAGDEEVRYFSALYMLGTQIDWNQLGITTGSAGIPRVGGHL